VPIVIKDRNVEDPPIVPIDGGVVSNVGSFTSNMDGANVNPPPPAVFFDGFMQRAMDPFVTNFVGPSGVRWNTGHYLKTQGKHAQVDQDAYWDTDPGSVNNSIDNDVDDTVSGDEVFIGAYATIAWGAVNTTGSTMDFSRIDTVVNNLRDNHGDKKFILLMSWQATNTSEVGVMVPADMSGDTSPTFFGSGGFIANYWEAAVMERFNLAMEAVADRYNDNPNFEMFCVDELATGFGGTENWPVGYSRGAQAAQLDICYTRMAAAWSRTNVCPFINFLGPNHHITLTERCYQLGIGVGAPDARTISQNEVIGRRVWKGLDGAVRDYRGTVGRMEIVSQSAFDRPPQPPPSEIIDDLQTARASHVCWTKGTAFSGTSYTDVKSAIQADPGVETMCPSQYSSCNTA